MFSALELALTQSVRHLSKGGEDGAVAQYLDRYLLSDPKLFPNFSPKS